MSDEQNSANDELANENTDAQDQGTNDQNKTLLSNEEIKDKQAESVKEKKAGAEEGAPEKYEFTKPEGVEVDDLAIVAFSEVAKELNLPQGKAQKFIDKVAPVLAQQQAKQMKKARAEWVTSAKSDKEFGGEKLNENLAVAKKAYNEFATEELKSILDRTGFGDHPEIIRLFYRAGKHLSEDNFLSGTSSKSSSSQDELRKQLYPGLE